MSRYRNNELCEPCFDPTCARCGPGQAAMADRIPLRRRVRALENQLRQAVDALLDERNACSPEEVRDSPILAAHSRIIERACKVLSK